LQVTFKTVVIVAFLLFKSQLIATLDTNFIKMNIKFSVKFI